MTRSLSLTAMLLAALGACPADPVASTDTAEPAADTSPVDTADGSAIDTSPGEDTIRPSDTQAADARPDTDGPVTTCAGPDDCVLCSFGRPPGADAPCVCPTCPRAAITAELCAFSTDAWTTRCQGLDAEGGECPRLDCPEPGPVACERTVCVDPCAAVACPALPCEPKEQVRLPGACCPACPGLCAGPSDCVICRLDLAPATEDDCACPECPAQPLPRVDCAVLDAAFGAVCGAWVVDKGCEAPVCPEPTPLTCDRGTCTLAAPR